MNTSSLKRLAVKFTLLTFLVLPELANAQFKYNPFGDVLAGFRKTSSFAGTNEFVVDLGSVTNFLNITAGTTVNITNYTPSVLNYAFSTGLTHLQWSVFSASYSASVS